MSQPKALFLADVIEADPASKKHHDEAAAELRRLHNLEKAYDSVCNMIYKQDKKLKELEIVNRELLESLAATCVALRTGHNALIALEKARAAIAKAEGEKT